MYINPLIGCAERAHLFSKSLVRLLQRETHKGEQYVSEKQFHLPFKHFAFGELIAQTPNARKNGQVRWRYHVAPIVKLNDDQFYILDPALSADPIAKDEWYGMIVTTPNQYKVKSATTGLVTCWPNTYTPIDECFDPSGLFRHGELVNERIMRILTL